MIAFNSFATRPISNGDIDDDTVVEAKGHANNGFFFTLG